MLKQIFWLTFLGGAVDLHLRAHACGVLGKHRHSVGGDGEELLENDGGLRSNRLSLQYLPSTAQRNVGEAVSDDRTRGSQPGHSETVRCLL